MKLLVVDDDAAQTQSLRLFLEANGHEVFYAGNGLGAKSLLEAHTIDAAIVDVVMPGMDGVTFYVMVREVPAWKNLPVILTTGLPDCDIAPVDRVVADDSRARVLQKPYQPELLLEHLAEIGRSGNEDKGTASKPQ